MNGLLLFNKPIGWTSHDAVAYVRRRINVKKVGHAGTLDPMATGLLILLVGSATRSSEALSGLDKDYRGIFELGMTTDTQDLEGRLLSVPVGTQSAVPLQELERSMKDVAERGEQVPPAFSAIKRGGRPSYRSARQGTAVVLDARPSVVHAVRLERYDPPEAEFFLHAAKGFYVRTFCSDVGALLGCGAVLTCLVRTRIGPYRLEDACGPEVFEKTNENLQRFLRPAP